MKNIFFVHSWCKFILSFVLHLLIGTTAFAQSNSDSLTSYSTIRTDTNKDNILDYLGEEVTITGIANINSGLLHEHYLQIFIQNDSTGMSVFAMEIDEPVEVGDSLVVKGKIEEYNGLAEVHADNYELYKRASESPSFRPLSAAIEDPARYLGMLVEGEGSIIEKGSTFNGKYIRVSQENGFGNMMVYVSNFHRLFDDFNFEILRVGDKVSVKGIITEYNPEFPNERHYKLFLRTPSDLGYASLPQFYIYLFFGGFALVTLFIIGWVVVLRNKVDSKTNEIQSSLKEKEVLLREIHHRVKNSLAIISGLIELQLDSTDSKEARNVLQNSQTRLQSVGLIHEKLYQTDSFTDIELDHYIKDLVQAIHSTFTEYKDDVQLVFDVERIELNIDRVIPCGLLINELVVNAFKHAFRKGQKGRLDISLRKQGEEVVLKVSDNGSGLSTEFGKENQESLGTLLINSFASQLKAKMKVDNKNGATFTFTFPY
ncbi:MAG: histidine kinase dimerization/phosphoacceptor domain -containing protein [Gracilimonas sp.]